MNIYEFRIQGEKEWVTAPTLIKALKVYEDITDNTVDDIDDEDDVVLLTNAQAKKIKIRLEEDNDRVCSLYSYAKDFEVPEYLGATVY